MQIDTKEAKHIDRLEFIVGMRVGHRDRSNDFLRHEQKLQIKSLEKDAKR
jgi:hypothetical protein